MAAEPEKTSSVVCWDDWPAQSIVGRCRIRVHHSDNSPRKALSVVAEPENVTKDWGAYIHCSLPATSRKDIAVRPPFHAYWSSRRRSEEARKYFNEYLPHVDVAVLQAMSSGEFADRELAAFYLVFPINTPAVELLPGETCHSIASDERRFNEVTRAWLASRVSTTEGAKTIAQAQGRIDDAAIWFSDLTSFNPSGSEPNAAKLTQCAIYRAICNATLAHQGIPTFSQVRLSFLDVIVEWEKAHPLVVGREAPPKIRYEGFDQAIKNLGFSWLPRSLKVSN
jgi:hypothetical protein